MIEISFGKLLLLALIALLVLGPEKLPGAARTAGALVRRVRGSWESVRAEVTRELEIEEIKRTARAAAASAEAAQAQMKSAAREVREAIGSVTAEPAAAAPPAQDDESPQRLAGAPAADALDMTDEAPERDTHTGDLFAGEPEHAKAKEPPHGLA